MLYFQTMSVEFIQRLGEKVRGRLELLRLAPIGLIVEGGRRGVWVNRNTVELKAKIPRNCVRIRFAMGSELTLVGSWDPKGIRVGPILEDRAGETLYINRYPLERPATVVTEDGRIFHDLELLQDEHDSQRLPNFLTDLSEKDPAKYPLEGIESLRERIREYRLPKLEPRA